MEAYLTLPIKNFELLEEYRKVLGEEKLKRFLEGENFWNLVNE